jgi:hypothetical protein
LGDRPPFGFRTGACCITKEELEEMLQEALDGKLGCLIKLARHYYKLQDDERLSRAIDALLTKPEAA